MTSCKASMFRSDMKHSQSIALPTKINDSMSSNNNAKNKNSNIANNSNEKDIISKNTLKSIAKIDAEPVDIVIGTLTGLGAFCSTIGVSASNSWVHSNHFEVWQHKMNYLRNEYKTTRTCAIFGTMVSIGSVCVAGIRLKFSSLASNKTMRIIYVISMSISFLFLLISLIVWADFIKHAHVKSSSSILLSESSATSVSSPLVASPSRNPKKLFPEKTQVNIKLSHNQSENFPFNQQPIYNKYDYSSNTTKLVNSNATSHISKINREFIPKNLLFLLPKSFFSNFDEQEKKLSRLLHLGWAYWLTAMGVVNIFLANLLHLMRRDCKRRSAPVAIQQQSPSVSYYPENLSNDSESHNLSGSISIVVNASGSGIQESAEKIGRTNFPVKDEHHGKLISIQKTKNNELSSRAKDLRINSGSNSRSLATTFTERKRDSLNKKSFNSAAALKHKHLGLQIGGQTKFDLRRKSTPNRMVNNFINM